MHIPETDVPAISRRVDTRVLHENFFSCLPRTGVYKWNRTKLKVGIQAYTVLNNPLFPKAATSQKYARRRGGECIAAPPTQSQCPPSQAKQSHATASAAGRNATHQRLMNRLLLLIHCTIAAAACSFGICRTKPPPPPRINP